jgi:hypothetical protein
VHRTSGSDMKQGLARRRTRPSLSLWLALSLCTRAGALFGTSPVPSADADADAGPPWRDLKSQPCNLGLQDKYGKPFWHGTRPFATCGVYNEETDIDFTGKPCCCEFCGQRDSFDQLCEISTLLCTTVDDCIQRHNGVCKASPPARHVGGLFRLPDTFHMFWMTLVAFTTLSPFIVPVFALWYAQDIILGF